MYVSYRPWYWEMEHAAKHYIILSLKIESHYSDSYKVMAKYKESL